MKSLVYYVVKRGIAKNAISVNVQRRIACEWTSAGESAGIATGTTHGYGSFDFFSKTSYAMRQGIHRTATYALCLLAAMRSNLITRKVSGGP